MPLEARHAVDPRAGIRSRPGAIGAVPAKRRRLFGGLPARRRGNVERIPNGDAASTPMYLTHFDECGRAAAAYPDVRERARGPRRVGRSEPAADAENDDAAA